MDVQCERCKTEYEFDDALVSGRGTTVKCTNCGFQFKVHKKDTSEQGADDRWLVRTKEGQQHVFITLKELQRAILAKGVGRHDTLTRGNAPPRALGSIAELAPFFDEKKRMSSIPPPGTNPPPPFAAPPPQRRASYPAIGEVRTGNTPPMGSPAVRSPRSTPPPPMTRGFASRPPPPGSPPEGAADGGHSQREQTSLGIGTTRPHTTRGTGVTTREQTLGEQTLGEQTIPEQTMREPTSLGVGTTREAAPHSPRREKVDTLRPGAAGGMPPPPALPRLATLPHVSPPTPNFSTTAPMAASGAPLMVSNVSNVASLRPEVSSPLPMPTATVRGRMPSYDDADPMRAAMIGADDPVLVPGLGSRRRVGGWVVAALLVGCVSIGVFLMAKPYLSGGGAGAKTVASVPLDPRAQEFLRTGERALDEGDFEVAKENFDKASVVAEKDSRVLVDLARLAASRADVPWLRLKLGADDDSKRAVDELGARAKSAADAALLAIPDDAAAIRAKIDALRIAGDREGARGLVSKVIANASQPETAYVLAALDLAEPEPLWHSIVERLRVAAHAEGNAGRARAALVYALARSGDAGGARAELDKLNNLKRPHPLASALKAFLDKAPTKPRADGGLATTAAVDVNTLPKDRPPVVADPNAPPAAPRDQISGDGKSLVFQANTALARRDYARASQLYAAALDKNPNDSEAQGGLGDVAHAQRDLAGAKSSYTKAIAINSHYLSAQIGLGDVLWEMGDRAGAQRKYKDIMDNFPDGSYPAHVKERGNQAPAPVAAPTDKPTADPTPTAPSPGTP